MSSEFFWLLKRSFNSIEISALGKVAYVYDSEVMLDKSRLDGPEKIQGDIHRVWFGTSGIWCFAWTKAASSQFVYIWDARNPRSPNSPISFKHDFVSFLCSLLQIYISNISSCTTERFRQNQSHRQRYHFLPQLARLHLLGTRRFPFHHPLARRHRHRQTHQNLKLESSGCDAE